MRRLSHFLLATVSAIGCSAKIDVPAGTPVQYENLFTEWKVAVDGALADEIVTVLRDDPDEADKGVHMRLDTRKRLTLGAMSFQVTKGELVLLDDWGVRRWKIRDIEARLDALAAASTKPHEGGT